MEQTYGVLKIGTRGSNLALTQSRWVGEKIQESHPGLRVELVRIKTTGDKILDAPLSTLGGKGLFVKEIEDALIRGQVDLAVHSIKDVPAELPQGLALCSFPRRENPYDALVSTAYGGLEDLPPGARVGTGSLRRAAQILHKRPDLELIPIRGNVDTRLRKLEAGELQAVILAAAGLKRLGLTHRITQIMRPEVVLPAIGQGALGLEVRAHDTNTIDLLRPLNHPPTEVTVRAERAFLRRLEGGCQVPLAAHARLDGETLVLRGMVAKLDGSALIRDHMTGKTKDAEALGIELAEKLLAAGADRILADIFARDP